MLLPGALPQRLFLRVFSFIATNQHKLLSMSMLHKNMSFSNQGQSSSIKPDRVIF
jgi:hypothetical protein